MTALPTELPPSISIAMCTFNGELYLGRQLESFSRQSILPSELVVCDDRSTDRTVEILESFAKSAKFKVRIVVNQERLGSTRNFEKAILLCEHELIALSDQDDIWHPEKLQTLASILSEQQHLGGLFTDGVLIGPGDQRYARTLWQSFGFVERHQRRFESGNATEMLLRENRATGMTMIFRASLRPALLPIPPSWNHDAWLALMLSLHSNLGMCSKRLVSYRLHASQQIGTAPMPLEKLKWIYQHGVPAFIQRAKKRSLEDYAVNARRFDDLANYLLKEFEDSRRSLISRVSAKAQCSAAMFEALSKPRRERCGDVLRNAMRFRDHSPVTVRSVMRDLIA